MNTKDPQEQEANEFVRDLLCPACVLNSLKIKTASEIEDIAFVTYDIARTQLLEYKNKNRCHTADARNCNDFPGVVQGLLLIEKFLHLFYQSVKSTFLFFVKLTKK